MAEEVIFQDATATVTTARVILGGTTYALANITSVKTLVEPVPSGVLLVGILLALLGVGFVTADVTALGLGGLFIGVVLGAVYFTSKPKHWVRIGTAGAESNAVSSEDPAWTARVVNAINDAIIRRG